MIIFAWKEFPQYAARCIGAFVRATDESVVVVATRPLVPINGMESVCNCPVHWIDGAGSFDCPVRHGEGIALFTTGWDVPAFNRLRDQVRARGGRTICLVDNNFIPSFVEIIRAIRFNLLFRRHYDAFVVPGRSGRKLLRFYGVPDDMIREGSYAADESLFTPGPALAERPKRIVYVGQFCERKNVKRLVEAFRRSLEVLRSGGLDVGAWSLGMYGSGPLKEKLVALAGTGRDGTVEVHDFLQPEELAAKYREARIFCLPSVEEHWGLVVHEAALSGCALLLSNRVGAADDLLEEGVNGLAFDPYDIGDMSAKFAQAMARTFETEDVSERARGMGVSRFVDAVKGCLGRTPCR